MQLFVDFIRKAGYISSDMNLSDKLKKMRTKNKLSMSEVARLSQQAIDHRGRITQGYISRLESGQETNPSLQKIMTLSKIYKVEPNDFFPKTGRKRA
jgi:transcriptional regulator with XRE-family HTH domain